MSTDIQLKGDSRRRQLELSKKFASDNGLELVPEQQLEDIGISAYRGANIQEGALGKFFTAVRNKQIESGSFLLVESLDRISRQDIMKSLSLFVDLVNSGINIVTLADGHTYSAGKTKLEDLIYSIVVMSRAHEESQTKSIRVSAAWANKRKLADKNKLTSICPAWLSLSKKKKRFEINDQRAQVVKSIFEQSADGIGNYTLTKRLNETRVPTFGKSKGWHSSYVAKILANRAVIGECQPHRMVAGKRVPDGEPISDYFPRVVSEELFYRAQNARSHRKISGSGRKGPSISNLFSGLLVCSYCNGAMRFENKGHGPKGSRAIVCDNARRGLGCIKTSWRYESFEASFLAFVTEVDLATLLRKEQEDTEEARLTASLAAIQGKLLTLRADQDRVFELFRQSGSAIEFVNQKLTDIEAELANTQKRCDALQQELEIARSKSERRRSAFVKTRLSKLFHLRPS